MRFAIPAVLTALSIVGAPAGAQETQQETQTQHDIQIDAAPVIRLNAVPLTIPAAPGKDTAAATQQAPAADTAPPAGAAPAVPVQGAKPETSQTTRRSLSINDTDVPITADITVERMPSGRPAIIFGNPADLPSAPVEGFEPQILPDGRAALVHMGHQPFPPGADKFLKLRGIPTITASGPVDGKTEVAVIPFAYRQTFHLKDEVTYKPVFGKEKTLVAPGAEGFYGGHFLFHGAPTQMLCLFGATPAMPDKAYVYPHCYLKAVPNVGDPYIDVGLLNNVPLGFTVTSVNYSEVIHVTPAFAVEDGDFPIAHDFKLSLSFKAWVEGRPVVTWKSDDTFLRDEALEADANGVFDIRIAGGRLRFDPVADDGKKTVVTFTPDAKPQTQAATK